MNDLLTLEPRDAGPAVIDPVVEFKENIRADRSRTRCLGCCFYSSNVEIATQSAGG
jgi:hypothetical protein